MARPIYPHELSDPDFQWLINAYRESKGQVAVVDMSCLPLIMVLLDSKPPIQDEDATFEPLVAPPPAECANPDGEGVPSKK
jgi:hypothetical protein